MKLAFVLAVARGSVEGPMTPASSGIIVKNLRTLVDRYQARWRCLASGRVCSQADAGRRAYIGRIAFHAYGQQGNTQRSQWCERRYPR